MNGSKTAGRSSTISQKIEPPKGYARLTGEGDLQPDDLCYDVIQKVWRRFDSPEWTTISSRIEHAWYAARKAGYQPQAGQTVRRHVIKR